MIPNLLTKVDSLLIGGGMAYTFLKAQGHEIGKSLLEGDKIDDTKQMMAQAKAKRVKVMLPIETRSREDRGRRTIQHIGEGQAIRPT